MTHFSLHGYQPHWYQPTQLRGRGLGDATETAAVLGSVLLLGVIAWVFMPKR